MHKSFHWIECFCYWAHNASKLGQKATIYQCWNFGIATSKNWIFISNLWRLNSHTKNLRNFWNIDNSNNFGIIIMFQTRVRTLYLSESMNCKHWGKSWKNLQSNFGPFIVFSLNTVESRISKLLNSKKILISKQDLVLARITLYHKSQAE